MQTTTRRSSATTPYRLFREGKMIKIRSICAFNDYGKHVPAINNVNVIYVMQSSIFT